MAQDKRYTPKIEATSIEEFEAKLNKLNSLPEQITDQIERVSYNSVGLCLEFKYNYKKEVKLVLPNYVTQITPFDGDYIGIYAGDFFFKIPNTFKDCNITYLFIDVEKQLSREGKTKKS